MKLGKFVLISAAGVAVALLSLPAAAAEFRCGKDYITFPTTGPNKDSPISTITVQKRMVLFVHKNANGKTAVALGRDGVGNTGSSHISKDIYKLLIKCLF